MQPIELPQLPDLFSALHDLLRQVPEGHVTTYGDLAKGLGNVIASRWVASCLLHDKLSTRWPSHRVVRADGSLGLYAHGDANDKANALRAEGVSVAAGRVDLNTFGVRQFRSKRPLEALRKLQDEIPSRCVLAADEKQPKTVAGLDVSYAEGRIGVGGYALVDTKSGELLWSTTVECEVNFPYVSSYLAFRELPVLAELLHAADKANQLADVYMIDGAGIMHPRRAGVATHLGVIADIPTIGITKKLLAGKFDDQNALPKEPRDVNAGEERLGVALRPRETSKRFIWASPGHRMDVPTATELTIRLLCNRRLPAPIYWADRLSRQAIT